MKYKTCSHLKRGLWTTGQQSSSSSLIPGKTPLTICSQIPRRVCVWCSWCLDPSLSPFLVKFTQILELILLDNPHTAAVLSVGCASFSSTQLSVNMLGYSTLWTASLVMNVCVLLSLWRVSMIVFWTTVRSAVFPMIVSPSEPNWDHFEGSGNLCRCFELISWYHHILISWDVNWWVFVKCEPKTSQLKEPKT